MNSQMPVTKRITVVLLNGCIIIEIPMAKLGNAATNNKRLCERNRVEDLVSERITTLLRISSRPNKIIIKGTI